MMYKTCFLSMFLLFDNKVGLVSEFEITFLSSASCFLCLTFSVEQL